jgi:hypothetical protein
MKHKDNWVFHAKEDEGTQDFSEARPNAKMGGAFNGLERSDTES